VAFQARNEIPLRIIKYYRIASVRQHSAMAYLVLRTPRVLARTSSIVSTCIRNKPAVLNYRAASSTVGDAPIDESLLPRPIDRSHETPDITRARLLYQSRKRGILETDLLLSTFAHKHLATMSETEMREYDQVKITAPQS
jgi:hypothetical protein